MIRARATLRIFSPHYNLDQLSELLGYISDGGHSKGAPISTRNSKPRQESLWLMRSTLDEKDSLEKHVAALLDRYAPIKKKAEAIEGAAVDIFAFVSSDNGQGGFTLSSTLAGELHTAAIPLVLDMYFTPEE